MIDELKPYAAVRDSGLPWLADVPEHWAVVPPKRILRSVSGGTAPIKNTASPERRDGFVPAFSASGQDVWLPTPMFYGPGLVLSAVGARCGRTFRADGAWAIVANTQALMVRSGHLRDYWWYVTNNEGWWERAGAAQPFVQVSKTLDRPWAVPPLAEQAAIVRFLDHADRRIARYIAAKKKLIALLNEQRHALVHCAVICGLDPNVSLKPSGLDWLGDVPEHWEVAPLRRRWTVTDCKHLTVPFVEDGIPLASVREVQSFELDLSTSRRTTMDWYETLVEGGRAPHRGDVVYCRNVSVGAAAFVNTDTPFAMGQDVCLIRSTDQSQRYLNYFLHCPAMGHQLAMLLVGSTFKRINVADIKSLIIAIPPRTEQDAIAAYLEQEHEHLDRPIAHARLQIDLMREYRTRLIADVVTGKLDVREAVTQLPHEIEESEPFDLDEALVEDDGLADEADLDDAAGGVEG